MFQYLSDFSQLARIQESLFMRLLLQVAKWPKGKLRMEGQSRKYAIMATVQAYLEETCSSSS